MPSSFPIRRALFAGVLLAVLLAGLRLLAVQGFVRPVRVVSGSMAPALLGPRYEATCGDCGYPIVIDAHQARGDESATCPNCGYAGIELQAPSRVRGERVLIDRGAFWLRRPRRFEAVAIRDPRDADRLAVKRIIGLPGETAEIRGGEVYVNGRRVRKSLDQLREIAVPVYDDRFRPQDENLPPRWRDADGRKGRRTTAEGQRERVGGGWSRGETGYSYPGDLQSFETLRSNPQFAWLRYRHWRCSPLPGLRTKESPVLDDFGYNLGPPRQLNAVTDLVLRCRLQTVGEGCLAVSLHDGRQTWQIRLWPHRGEASLWREGRKTAIGTFARQRDETPFLLEAAVCDRQILVAVNGESLFAHPFEPAKEPRRPSSTPIALGAAGLAVTASELVVSRDVFHLPPPGHGSWTSNTPLGEGEYLLLGDNAPISQDSRVWPQAAVPGSRLLGPVLPWIADQSHREMRIN